MHLRLLGLRVKGSWVPEKFGKACGPAISSRKLPRADFAGSQLDAARLLIWEVHAHLKLRVWLRKLPKSQRASLNSNLLQLSCPAQDCSFWA